ncbi:unnamed protein product [Spirodela intermedia]|uniref:Uncharacterized protein n=1 Tax=Spirodela intermedia TaxID=51605 RepID=A0ABN7EAF4_SPIIN|nr:unnamed protein product [Spirodela intermedia]
MLMLTGLFAATPPSIRLNSSLPHEVKHATSEREREREREREERERGIGKTMQLLGLK